jgi:hypothetical protein
MEPKFIQIYSEEEEERLINEFPLLRDQKMGNDKTLNLLLLLLRRW